MLSGLPPASDEGQGSRESVRSADEPDEQKRYRVVLTALDDGIGRIMTSPGQTYSVSIFIEHFIRDLGISRSLVSTLYSLGTLAGSLALPFVGRQIDRRGDQLFVHRHTRARAVGVDRHPVARQGRVRVGVHGRPD